jgi:Zn-finger nucleic acid-binding protein
MLAELDVPSDEPIGPLVTTEGTLRCLRCVRPMAVEHTHGAPGTEIDVCPEHGVWFDRGEMAIALERLLEARFRHQNATDHSGMMIEDRLLIWLFELFVSPPRWPERRRGQS